MFAASVGSELLQPRAPEADRHFLLLSQSSRIAIYTSIKPSLHSGSHKIVDLQKIFSTTLM